MITGSSVKSCETISKYNIARNVVEISPHPASTSVAELTTPNQTLVSMTYSAKEILGMMIQRKCMHLLVVDKDELVVELLDIGIVLDNKISKIEKM